MFKLIRVPKLTRKWRRSEDGLLFCGVYEWEHVREGRVIASSDEFGLPPNIVVIQGNNHMFDVEFHGEVQVGTWYLGLIEGATAPVAGDTLASHGFTENSDYTGDRKAWIEGPSANRVIETANPASRAEFDFTTTEIITGAFLCSVATGTTGILFSGSLFAASRTLNEGDTLRVGYKLTGASS